MAAIRTGFDNIPKEDAKGARAAYAAIFSDLERLGLPKPTGKTADDVTRSELVEQLRDIAGEKLGLYIAGAPSALDGATTDTEIAERINAGDLVNVWGALPGAPNAITADDVAAARLMGV